MSGGTVGIHWDRETSAEVTIYGAGGQVSNRFTVNGSPVTFPYTLSADKSFVTTTDDTYSVSVVLNDVEIAAKPDGRLTAELRNGVSVIFAPSPDDGFVSPTGGSGGGGSAVADGVGSVFFGGAEVAATLDGTRSFSTFIASDDGVRAPQRDDLMVIDPDDDTVINIVRSGLYDITMNTPVKPVLTNFDPNSAAPENMYVRLEADVQFEVNGASQPPIYDYNNRAYWLVLEDFFAQTPACTLTLTSPQILLAGDTCRLSVRGRQIPGGPILSGSIHLDPDITLVITYRGPVE